jgi:hypothetical protein
MMHSNDLERRDSRAWSGGAEWLVLTERMAESKPVSSIFAVNGALGEDCGITQLIDLMQSHGTLFYGSTAATGVKGSEGLIARDDIIIVKVNSQWDERGGTNTDLLKALIRAITQHPGGFSGEIVVADNGQGQYGSTGRGGSFDYTRNNAEDISQSMQKLVKSFADHKVTAYLWDRITTKRVREYSEGDNEDGYIIDGSKNPGTGLIVSYPKFKSRFGTLISFKLGVWNPETQSYDSDRLKVINVPVLKSHMIYGVTACVKHYMGVTSDKLTGQFGASSHGAIGAGGMGTELAETRLPILNIVDAIWVNANPGRGPGTTYESATRTNVIAASTDPVALDYWTAKNILIPTARHLEYSTVSSIDPDNTTPHSLGSWLRLSMEEITRAGYQATVDEARMNVYVANVAPNY